jgi:hypothetical protein
LLGDAIVQELFAQFLEAPGAETFQAVRSAVVASEAYEPYSRELDAANECIKAGKWEDARERLLDAMPNLLLSPTAHLMISYVADKLGDEKSRDFEGYIAHCCMEGILSTGDGSADHPYLVMRTGDEYDVLRYLEKEMQSQSLIESGDRHLDRLVCADGSEYWFDITDAYDHLAAQFEERDRRRAK